MVEGREQQVEGTVEDRDVRGPLDEGDLQPPPELAPVKQVSVADRAQGVGHLRSDTSMPSQRSLRANSVTAAGTASASELTGTGSAVALA